MQQETLERTIAGSYLSCAERKELLRGRELFFWKHVTIEIEEEKEKIDMEWWDGERKKRN